MNDNTRKALIEFAYAVELLAQCCIHETGVDNCTTIMERAERLKDKLKSDETIVGD